MKRKVAVISDLHIGNFSAFSGAYSLGLNNRVRLSLATLIRAVDTARRNKCSDLIVAGDVFDSWNSSPQVVAGVMDALSEDASLDEQMTVHLLAGNHDQHSPSKQDSALEPLGYMPESSSVLVHDVARYREDFLFLPYSPNDPLDVIGSKAQPGTRVIFLHAGLADDATSELLRQQQGALEVSRLIEAMRLTGATFAFAGHWHNSREWQLFDTIQNRPMHVVQTGTLCPASFRPTEVGIAGFGRMYLFDPDSTAKPTYVEIPGPRFVLVHDELELKQAIGACKGCNLFVRGVYEPGKGAEMAAMLKANEVALEAWEAVPDQKAVSVGAREAANRAALSSTAEEAIEEYIDGLKVEEVVDKKAVHSKVTEHLGRVR